MNITTVVKNNPIVLENCQTIKKQLVHRTAINEVFLTDMKQLSNNSYIIAAQLPRTHMYFNDVQNGYHDATLLLEVFRQVSICITHHFYDIPYSTKFIFNEAGFKIVNDTFLNNTNIPLEVTVEVNVTKIKKKKESITGLNLDMSMYVNEDLCAIKSMDITWMSDLVWKKLRSKILNSQNLLKYENENPILPAIKPNDVGHAFHRNVVIKELNDNSNEILTSLCIDQSYPGLFDHELDHVPGMVLIEMLKQTAIIGINKSFNIYANRLQLIECDVLFLAFCELSEKTECLINKNELKEEIRSNNDKIITVQLNILQDKKIITTGNLKFKHVNSIN